MITGGYIAIVRFSPLFFDFLIAIVRFSHLLSLILWFYHVFFNSPTCSSIFPLLTSSNLTVRYWKWPSRNSGFSHWFLRFRTIGKKTIDSWDSLDFPMNFRSPHLRWTKNVACLFAWISCGLVQVKPPSLTDGHPDKTYKNCNTVSKDLVVLHISCKTSEVKMWFYILAKHLRKNSLKNLVVMSRCCPECLF